MPCAGNRLRTVRILLWCGVAAWMGLIFFFSSQNGEQSASLSGGVIRAVASFLTPGFHALSPARQEAVVAQFQHIVRKGAHFSEYAVLGALLTGALLTHRMRWRIRIPTALAVSLLYAAGDEFHQAFIPGRGPGIGDVLIDFSGAALGVTAVSLTAVLLLRHRRKNRGISLPHQKNGPRQ